MSFERQVIGISIGLSVLGHVLLIATAPRTEPARSAPAPTLIELSIEQPASLEPEHHAAATEAPRTPAPQVATARPQPPIRRARTISAISAPNETQTPTVPPAPAVTSATTAPNLMPQFRSACGPTDQPAREECTASVDIAARAAAEQTLNASLHAAANRPGYRNAREPPKLVPAADGGYEYAARAHHGVHLLFKAHIANDGTVRFDDGANVQLAPIPIGGTFDFHNALRGEQHTAEKRWFLEETAALRGRLADAARSVEDRRVQRMIEQALTRIREGSQSLKAKHDAIFELWLGCEDAPQPRAQIEAWIRAHMPQGSALAFTQEALTALNRGRHNAARFAPYEPR